jgi:hypothetical protein
MGVILIPSLIFAIIFFTLKIIAKKLKKFSTEKIITKKVEFFSLEKIFINTKKASALIACLRLFQITSL